MKLQTILFVTDMPAAVAFYTRLGLERTGDGEIDPAWNEFRVGDATLALHQGDDASLAPVTSRTECWLQVPADGTLDTLLATCEQAGIPVPGGIEDMGFGRYFRVFDPDGYPIQIGEVPGQP